MPNLPVIDISGLRSDSLDTRRAVAAELGRASREIGFFYVAGHTLDQALMARTFAASRQFFALSAADKHALSIKRSDNDVGYIALDDEQLDPTAPADHKEAFNIGLELPLDHPAMVERRPFRGANFWPDLPGWRETLLDYYDRCWSTRASAWIWASRRASSRTSSTNRSASCACCTIPRGGPKTRGGWAPAPTATTATSPCWPPTGWTDCRCAGAAAAGSTPPPSTAP